MEKIQIDTFCFNQLKEKSNEDIVIDKNGYLLIPIDIKDESKGNLFKLGLRTKGHVTDFYCRYITSLNINLTPGFYQLIKIQEDTIFFTLILEKKADICLIKIDQVLTLPHRRRIANDTMLKRIERVVDYHNRQMSDDIQTQYINAKQRLINLKAEINYQAKQMTNLFYLKIISSDVEDSYLRCLEDSISSLKIQKCLTERELFYLGKDVDRIKRIKSRFHSNKISEDFLRWSQRRFDDQ